MINNVQRIISFTRNTKDVQYKQYLQIVVKDQLQLLEVQFGLIIQCNIQSPALNTNKEIKNMGKMSETIIHKQRVL